MKNLSKKLLVFSLLLGFYQIQVAAATLEEQARAKISTLTNLMNTAKNKGLDVTKEEMTIHTAELFLDYAQWDENNISFNTEQFAKHDTYKNQASEMAKALPDYEREEVIKILDKQIAEVEQVLSGEIKRPTAMNPDWDKVVVESDQITQDGKPVFLADYVWKPRVDRLTKYYGDSDIEGLRGVHITNANGDYNQSAYNFMANRENNSIGQIWIDALLPGWIKSKYPEIEDGGRHFGPYDPDHPAMRDLYGAMFKNYVPALAGKRVTHLGYQLFNEPSYFTQANTWNNTDKNGKCVSDYTIAKFKNWLQDLHGDIGTLNRLWGTNFNSFNNVNVPLPMPKTNQGGAMWYDWMTFNEYRITDWFRFMDTEIKKYDPQGKSQVKVMPWTFTTNQRDQGLNFEAITELSDIIGCDAGMRYDHAWDKNASWRKNYAAEWRPAIMTFDFMKSVKPNAFIFDTENHFLMHTGFNLQEINQDYARMSYWLAAMHGLVTKATWVWTRNGDGSQSTRAGESSMTDMSHQPQNLHTVTSTFMDLTSFGSEMVQIQRLPKTIRVFYSETSAINDGGYLDKVFEVYESVFFEGIPIGFATENILKRGFEGEVVIVHNTEFVTAAELQALQNYLNAGGTVILGANSLKKNEYSKALPALTKGNGTIINANTIGAIKTQALSVIESRGLSPELSITESNANNAKGCTWKYIKRANGNYVLSIINIGNKTANINISAKNDPNATLTDLFTGKQVNKSQVLEPFGMLFLEVGTDGTPVNSAPNVSIETPTNQQTFANGSSISVKATASDADGIANLKLYVNNALVREDDTAPYEWGVAGTNDAALAKLDKGTYTLKVEAEDKTGKTASKSIIIYVSDPAAMVIEAESFSKTDGTYTDPHGNGVVIEDGTNIGWVNKDDYAEYMVNIPETGNYNITYLIGSPNDNTQILFLVDDVLKATDNVPNNGNYKNFEELTSGTKVLLTAGEHKITIKGDPTNVWQWNLDKFTLSTDGDTATLIESSTQANIKLSPNPFDNTLQIVGNTQIASVRVTAINGIQAISTAVNATSTVLNTSDLTPGIYLIHLSFENGEQSVKKVIKL